MAKNSHSVLFFVEPQVVYCIFCIGRCNFSSCFCAKTQFLQEWHQESLEICLDVQTIVFKVINDSVRWKCKNKRCWSNYSQTWESFSSKFSSSSLKKLSRTWSTWSFSFSVISKIKNWIKFKKLIYQSLAPIKELERVILIILKLNTYFYFLETFIKVKVIFNSILLSFNPRIKNNWRIY